MASLTSLAVYVLGTHAVAHPFQRLTQKRLRVVAYHDIRNASAFAAHLDYLASRYSVVSASDVLAAAAGAVDLPPNAVWLTFDDGWADVVGVGLPLLAERKLSATMFVCPGVVEADGVHWWQRIDQATSLGWTVQGMTPAGSRAFLKSVDDTGRRRFVKDATTWCAQRSAPPLDYSVADETAIRRWLSGGMEVGNHTWDHPVLDRCSVDDQRSQVLQAHDWLVRVGGRQASSVFAYPNGDWTADTEAQLQDLDYRLGLLFDHRVSRLPVAHSLRISRLRLDSDAPAHRMRAVLSGAHSAMHSATQGLPIRNRRAKVRNASPT